MINLFVFFTLPAVTLLSQGVVEFPSINEQRVPAVVSRATSTEKPRITLVPEGAVNPDAGRTFIIVHGCGGTVPGDRFHRLADAIKRILPTANVYRLDWTVAADKKLPSGFPDPWAAARNIDSTGDTAARMLRELKLDSSKLTLIGESFGVYVNHRIVQKIGKVRRVLAMNPASELGGYLPPVLDQDAERVCVFSSASCLDTHKYVCGRALRLLTEANVSQFEQHRYGIEWLCQQLEGGDMSWLELARELKPADKNYLSGSVYANGELDPLPVERVHRSAANTSPAPSAVVATSP